MVESSAIAYYATLVVHVVAASAWLGGSLFLALVLQPLMRRSGTSFRASFADATYVASIRFFNRVGGLTVLTGLVLVTLHSKGWNGLLSGAWGRGILFGLLAALMALYLVNVSLRPTVRVLRDLGAAHAEAPEPPANLRFLQARLRFSILLLGIILAAAMVAMLYADAVAPRR